MRKGFTLEQLGIMVLVIITISVIVYALLVKLGIIQTETETEECSAMKLSYCAQWKLRNYDATYKPGWAGGARCERPAEDECEVIAG